MVAIRGYGSMAKNRNTNCPANRNTPARPTSPTTTTPSRAPFAGFTAQLALLALLAGTAGLTLAGGIAGIAYGVVLCALLGTPLDRAGMTFLFPK